MRKGTFSKVFFSLKKSITTKFSIVNIFFFGTNKILKVGLTTLCKRLPSNFLPANSSCSQFYHNILAAKKLFLKFSKICCKLYYNNPFWTLLIIYHTHHLTCVLGLLHVFPYFLKTCIFYSLDVLLGLK